MESSDAQRGGSNPSRYPVETRWQVAELARSGTRVAQLPETFGISEAARSHQRREKDEAGAPEDVRNRATIGDGGNEELANFEDLTRKLI